MPIIDATVTVNNGSKNFTFVGASLLDKGVKSGHWVKIEGEENKYHFELTPTNNTDGVMLETYGGVDQVSVPCQIFTDFSSLGRAILGSAVKDGYTIVEQDFQVIEDVLAAAGITSTTDYRKLPLFYAGMPDQDREFGQLQLSAPVEIAEIGITAEAPPDGGDVSLDIAIGGTYQSVANLKLTAGSYSNYVTVALNGSAGNVIKMKFTSVPTGVFPGQNYTIWIKHKTTSVLEIRYDFNVFSPGMAEAGKRIGRGFKPAVKSRYFGGMVRVQDAPLGANLKIALMFNDAQLAQTLTLTAGSLSEYTSFAQKDVLTTETIDTIITQPGTDFPGDNITVILYSYKSS